MNLADLTPEDILATLIGKPSKEVLGKIRAVQNTAEFQLFLRSFADFFQRASDPNAIHWESCALSGSLCQSLDGDSAAGPVSHWDTARDTRGPHFVLFLLCRPLPVFSGQNRGAEQPSSEIAAMPKAWQLLNQEGQEWLTLRGPAIQIAYGVAEQRARIRLHAFPVDDSDHLRPQIEIEPPPLHGALTVALRFAFSNHAEHRVECRTLTVATPLIAELFLDQSTSDLGDGLPTAAFSGNWSLSIEPLLPPPPASG